MVTAQLNQRMDQTITQSLTSRQPSAATGCVVPFFTQMKRGKGVISPTITYRVIFNIWTTKWSLIHIMLPSPAWWMSHGIITKAVANTIMFAWFKVLVNSKENVLVFCFVPFTLYHSPFIIIQSYRICWSLTLTKPFLLTMYFYESNLPIRTTLIYFK